jgi:hypothetical protein
MSHFSKKVLAWKTVSAGNRPGHYHAVANTYAAYYRFPAALFALPLSAPSLKRDE